VTILYQRIAAKCSIKWFGIGCGSEHSFRKNSNKWTRHGLLANQQRLAETSRSPFVKRYAVRLSCLLRFIFKEATPRVPVGWHKLGVLCQDTVYSLEPDLTDESDRPLNRLNLLTELGGSAIL